MIDAHDHLQDPAFSSDLAAVLGRAEAAGVDRAVCNGTRPEDWPRVLALAREYPAVVPCFGLHPWFVAEAPPGWLRTLEGFLDEVPSGVGEAGLDAGRGDAPAQEKAFRAQLALSREKKRPLTVHCVRAFGRLLDILREEGPLPAGFLLHGYGGASEMVAPFAGLGAYFSFTGPRRALAAVPADRLLLETDCPGRKVRGEPADIGRILASVARARGEEESRLAESVRENGRRFLAAL